MEQICNIVISMREYQRINKIENQCVTNTQYLYDIFKAHNIDVNVKSVLVISTDEINNVTSIVNGHLIILLDDIVIDPSYDVYCLKNKHYYDTIIAFKESFDEEALKKLEIKDYITKFIKFTKLSVRIMNDILTIANKEHYNKQADYIEKTINT